MRNLVVLIVCLLAPSLLWAQAELKFENTSHDFGAVTEGDKAAHVFKFTNVGNAPLVISKVQPSCGCTTPEWPRTPILPGESGEIKAIYNSKGRPGRFNKTITVYSNAKRTSLSLSVQGDVQRDPNSNLKMGMLSFSGGNQEEAGKMTVGQVYNAEIAFTNTGNEPQAIKELKAPCNCMKAVTSSKTLQPGEKATITVQFTAQRTGRQINRLEIHTDSYYREVSYYYFKADVKEATASPLEEGSSSDPFNGR